VVHDTSATFAKGFQTKVFSNVDFQALGFHRMASPILNDSIISSSSS
jgi:hypothetical protein